MAQAGFTPISIYYSTTASNIPTAGNLVAGELAINTADGKLYFKNSSNVVTLLASSSVAALTLPVSTANGGTGATSLAAANIPVTNVANSFTGLQTFAGTSSNADLKTSNILETATISATAATGTINYDVTTQSVLYYTTDASGNFTVNFRGSSGTSLNTKVILISIMKITLNITLKDTETI